MIEFELPDITGGPYLFVVPLLAIGIYLLWPWSAARRQKWACQWAEQNLVLPTPEITDAVSREGITTSRLVGAIAVLTGAIAAVMALTSPTAELPPTQLWMLVICLGTLLTALNILRLQRTWLRPGATRTAHVRATHLNDYVAPWLRWGAWTGAGMALITIVISVALTPSPFTHANTVLNISAAAAVIGGLVLAEWSGRLAASRPQPARDVVELYAQDARRTGIARSGYQSIALWGGVITGFGANSLDGQPTVKLLLGLAGFGLLGWSAFSAVLVWHPMEWTRKRLWPTLRPGERVTADMVTP